MGLTEQPPFTPDQLAEARASLPPFARGDAVSPLLQSFCRYYGIDFADRFPGLAYRVGVIASDSHTLAVYRWLQPGASCNLLLVHGYFDHTGLYARLIEYGLAQRCNVLMFDLPGHGLSSGEPVVIDDFADYGRAIAAVLAAAEMPDLPLWSMAQSTGCAALIEFARQEPWPFAATVLLAPLVRPFGWQRVRIGHMLLGRFIDGVGRKFAANSSDQEFLQFVQQDPLQSRRVSLRWVGALRRWLATLPGTDLGVGPALVVQGDADKTVDWRFNIIYISTLFPGSQLEILPGAGHQLANESPTLRQCWLERVTAYLQGRHLLQAAPATDDEAPGCVVQNTL